MVRPYNPPALASRYTAIADCTSSERWSVSRAMGEGAAEIDYENDFEKKRAIIEGLNVTITLTIENGKKFSIPSVF